MVEGFQAIDLPAEGIADTRELSCRQVLVGRDEGAPGVILMHELPGMTKQCLYFARELRSAGFSVYLPLLFGQPGEFIFPYGPRGLCIMKEWSRLARGEDGPIAVWLRALARRVHAECSGQGVGAVGMCLTGGYVIPLLLEREVLAPVASQPSWPGKGDFGVSTEALATIKRRVSDEKIEILGLRYKGDPICRSAKFGSFTREFGASFRGLEYPGLLKHSVLTHHRQAEGVAETIRFLGERLLTRRARAAEAAGAAAPS
jgi:dienelactone hydrolase